MQGATAEGGLEEILALLRADGGRITPARHAVVTTLLGGDEHLSADDIAAQIQATLPDVSVSTVYRCLDALEQLGVVEHVHLGHGPSRYHLADRRHHVHLLCRRCGRVTEAPADYLQALSDRLGSEFGFALEPRHFTLLGTCSDCAD